MANPVKSKVPKRDNAAQIASDATAQRLLNLAFVFYTARRPLSTEQIVSDTDLGYGSDNRESDLRKFRRDREKLSSLGFFIINVGDDLHAKNEEALWELDRDETFAAGGIVSIDDALVLAHAIDTYLLGAPTPLDLPLSAVREKALEVAGGNLPSTRIERTIRQRDGRADAVLDAVWISFALRRTLRISYVNAQGVESRRGIEVFGIFSNQGAPYVVGFDDASGEVRTFRISRITRVLSPGAAYQIPADFNIHDRIFFPFDFGDGSTIDARFSLPGDLSQAQARDLTKGRGSLVQKNGTWLWTISVRNLPAAARFGLSHARDGMRPVSPEALLSCWNDAIDKVVETHEA